MTRGGGWAAFKRWEPHHLFYRTVLDKYVKYDSPHNIGFGFTQEGYWTDHREYTPLGRWFTGKPFILYLLVGFVYYPLAWPIWLVLHFIAGFFELFFVKWE